MQVGHWSAIAPNVAPRLFSIDEMIRAKLSVAIGSYRASGKITISPFDPVIPPVI